MPTPPPLYYLANFNVLIGHAQRVYDDLLNGQERQFIELFSALSTPAQCLYVRVLTRRGELVRADKLSYVEIPDVAQAAAELAAVGLLHIDSAAPANALLGLLTAPELLPIALPRAGTRSMRKEQLIEVIASAGDDVTRTLLRERIHWYQLGERAVVDTLSLLFFGNRRQDLSLFVITEIGHLRFERYALDGMRQFIDREDFAAYRRWLDLGDEIHNAIAERDIVDALTAANECVSTTPHRLAPSRRDRLLTRLVRFFEQQQCDELALTLASATQNSDEARHRARIIRKRRGEGEFSTSRARPQGIVIRDVALPAWQPGAAESLVLSTLVDAGYRGVHWENHFPCAVFGLLCWDILFMSVPGAFFNPFQLGPLDLFTPDFLPRRATELAERVNSIRREQEDWRLRLMTAFAGKQGIANHFVAWRHLEPVQLSNMSAALSATLAAAICERIAADPRRYRRGFPDLTLLSPEGELQFCEVKSPNDQLSTEQRDWLGFLRAQGSEAWVARIVVPAQASVSATMSSVQS